jgi:hypothetical protein
MNRRLALALTAGVSAAAFALTGCGGEQTAGTPSAPPASTQPSAPSAETTPTSAPATESTPTGKADDDGAKPSKQDIVAGLTTFYQENQGLPADKAKKFAVCMVDAMYDKAKTATLEAMRDGDPTKIATSDAGLVAEAGFTCQSALT